MLGPDPLGDPQPVDKRFARNLREHLTDHCEIMRGTVSKVRLSGRGGDYPAEGRAPMVLAFATVVFPSSTAGYKVTVEVSGDVQVGQEVPVHCCPFYPSQLYVLEWDTWNWDVCPRHRPALSPWRGLVSWFDIWWNTDPGKLSGVRPVSNGAAVAAVTTRRDGACDVQVLVGANTRREAIRLLRRHGYHVESPLGRMTVNVDDAELAKLNPGVVFERAWPEHGRWAPVPPPDRPQTGSVAP